MPAEGKRKRKVAVLGGGAAGLAAAWELSATKELCDEIEVTVHQLGWRLGGKGASGRAMEGPPRIEEHGLHIWFGWYQQAFDLMKRCYEELPADAKHPFASWDEAFKPFDTFVLMERYHGEWHGRDHTIPRRDGQPWEPHPAIQDLRGDALAIALREALEYAAEQLSRFARTRSAGLNGPWIGTLEEQAWHAQVAYALDTIGTLEDVIKPVSGSEWEDTPADAAERFLYRAAGARDSLLAAIPEEDDGMGVMPFDLPHKRDLIWFRATFDFAYTVIRGLFDERLFHGQKDFTGLDGEEFCAWLRRHGMRTAWANVPFVRGGFDLTFAYPGGDRGNPDLAAGVSLRNLLAILVGHRGGFMWKMQTGMGDAVFAPLYLVLRERGVKFRFFDWVESVGTGADGRLVEELVVKQQAKPRGDEYDPLIRIEKSHCWPARPLWDQLEDADALRAATKTLEEGVGPHATERRLARGTAFDDVVLAIPVSAHPSVCKGLLGHDDAYDAMVSSFNDDKEKNGRTGTVGTRALQLWLRPRPNAAARPELGSVAAGFDASFDTVADMRQVLAQEGWPATGGPGSVAYFCSVFPANDEKVTNDPFSAGGDAFIFNDLRKLWPDFSQADLWNPPSTVQARPLSDQYVRKSVLPHERYILSRAGTIRCRLDESWHRFPNLVLAGDWTRTGIDAGCVEAAVLSGGRAGRELLRRAGLSGP